MKSIIFCSVVSLILGLCTVIPSSAYAETPAAISYAGGYGSEGSPYQIANLAQLRRLSETSADWSSYFIQTADIDASETNTWNNGKGFSPIGNYSTKFTGEYKGSDHRITGLYINQNTNRVGMFGYVMQGFVANLSLTGITVSGTGDVGSLVGILDSSGSVANCSAAGTVVGSEYFVRLF